MAELKCINQLGPDKGANNATIAANAINATNRTNVINANNAKNAKNDNFDKQFDDSRITHSFKNY